LDRAALERAVAQIRWFHRIDLGDGIVTQGVDDSPGRLARLALPDDLTGKSVLDVGAWDGFYSFECERRGADRVVAVDSFSWNGPGWGTKAGFELAREVLGSNVEDREMEVVDLAPETVGVFDVVLFSGVLYHLRHPLLALERLATVTGELLIVETAVDLVGHGHPAMAFYPADELYHDPTNWWAPNPSALLAMMRDVGFTRLQVVRAPYRLPLRTARALTWVIKRRGAFLPTLNQGRCTVHGRRDARG
jgi:tRNA (mo5U34)-methyltransferase